MSLIKTMKGRFFYEKKVFSLLCHVFFVTFIFASSVCRAYCYSNQGVVITYELFLLLREAKEEGLDIYSESYFVII